MSDNKQERIQEEEEVTLIFLAAGMGRRFGGNKQLAELGPNGQSLMAYSAYDAIQAGYRRLLFILREDMVEEFMNTLGKNLMRHIEIGIVIQDKNMIPGAITLPMEREKPLGTGHALYCARKEIRGPFVILNADDLYGRTVLKDLLEALREKEDMVIPGYPVKKTLSLQGKVSRGILEINEQNELVSIREEERIWAENHEVYCEKNQGVKRIPEDTLVSMNIWGAQRHVLSGLESVFHDFLKEEGRNLLTDEFYLPEAMDALRKLHGIRLRIIEARDEWMGMTYQEDLKDIRRKLQEKIREGFYPDSLFGE